MTEVAKTKELVRIYGIIVPGEFPMAMGAREVAGVIAAGRSTVSRRGVFNAATTPENTQRLGLTMFGSDVVQNTFQEVQKYALDLA
ncbi:uncharacterized protein Z518_01749 [Rhinocladiella mackenziei CBS 650.93]|uniref:Rhinocladiella mackenziei CBS 650.93 unplaced genomic scaffold supercont1.1, whole genome shotgun sequence n=1 Tax=Rhinocladiella mackenziei CBS 650.93 TaxID=1442369 RepID=A0A0D2JMH4_9EURO|nr:uncharacterized protein Z518_01749 [Rhinocladiella mackenziei CBS 650.93]KIX10665.1 hypothetical protein Z518_01749 [Rhinocladiella mackenziei CBS 650.93]